jgi:TRAP-type C4-dicarboxylate transport system substrate-binding protein
VASLTLWDMYHKYKPEEFAKVKVLAWFSNPPSNIMSKKPIRKLDDLKGFPIRASGGAAEALKLWGANPVGMPNPETPEALQKGVVQGVFISLECLKLFNFAETYRYMTMINRII